MHQVIMKIIINDWEDFIQAAIMVKVKDFSLTLFNNTQKMEKLQSRSKGPKHPCHYSWFDCRCRWKLHGTTNNCPLCKCTKHSRT